MFLHFGLVFSGVRHLLLIHPDIALFLMLKERIIRFLFENSIHSITLWPSTDKHEIIMPKNKTST
jgi:hypothetical protein